MPCNALNIAHAGTRPSAFDELADRSLNVVGVLEPVGFADPDARRTGLDRRDFRPLRESYVSV